MQELLNTSRPAICDGLLLARLEVLVGRLADPWCNGWGRQLLCCRRGHGFSCYLSSYEQHCAHTYRLRLFH